MHRLHAAACGLIGLVVVFVPVEAHASCAPLKPRDTLTASTAAFIGRAIEQRGDRVVFAVDESIKGNLPDRVEVRDEHPGVTSIGNLGPPSVERVGLFVRRDADGGFRSNACSYVSPEGLRAAAASARARCTVPRVTRLMTIVRRTGPRRLRLQAELAHLDGSITGVAVKWGDGTSTRRDLQGKRRTRAVELRHQYGRSGLYRIRIYAISTPIIDCAARGREGVTETSRIRERPIRIR